jgi:hypothetical protein
MDGDVVPLKLPIECCVASPKGIDPYRRIRENHFAFALLRGTYAMSGAVPPNSASLRAASQ